MWDSAKCAVMIGVVYRFCLVLLLLLDPHLSIDSGDLSTDFVSAVVLFIV